MAIESREDRHLMRQRGAGVRDIRVASFGFTFGLPPPLPQNPVLIVHEQASPPKSTKKIPAKRKYVRKTGTVAKKSKSVVDASRTGPKGRGRPAKKVELDEVKNVADDQGQRHQTETSQDKALAPEHTGIESEASEKIHVTKGRTMKRGRPQKKSPEEQNIGLNIIEEGSEERCEELKPALTKTVKGPGLRKRKALVRPEADADHAEEAEEDNEDAYKPKSRKKRATRMDCNVDKTEQAPRKTRKKIVVQLLQDASTLKPPLGTITVVDVDTQHVLESTAPLIVQPRRRGRQVKTIAPVEELQPETLNPRGIAQESVPSASLEVTITTEPQSNECSSNAAIEAQTATSSDIHSTDLLAQSLSLVRDSSRTQSRKVPTKSLTIPKKSTRIHVDSPVTTETTAMRAISVTGRITRRAAEASRLRLQDIARSEAEDIAKENEDARVRSKHKPKNGKVEVGVRRRGRVPLGKGTVNVKLNVVACEEGPAAVKE